MKRLVDAFVSLTTRAYAGLIHTNSSLATPQAPSPHPHHIVPSECRPVLTGTFLLPGGKGFDVVECFPIKSIRPLLTIPCIVGTGHLYLSRKAKRFLRGPFLFVAKNKETSAFTNCHSAASRNSGKRRRGRVSPSRGKSCCIRPLLVPSATLRQSSSPRRRDPIASSELKQSPQSSAARRSFEGKGMSNSRRMWPHKR